MKFVYVTDTHFRTSTPVSRIDNILESLFEKFEWVLKYAAENNADILHGGDLYHTPSVPDFVATRVVKIFKKYGRQVYFIIGNHDVSGGNCITYDYSKIGLMAEYPWFHLIGGKTIEFKECYLSGFDYSKDMECPENIEVQRIINKPSICMIHSMLTDDQPIIVNGKNKTINWCSVRTDCDLILSGHFHPGWKGVRENPFGVRFINPGAMTRQTAAAEDMYRKPKIVIIEVKDGKLDIKFKIIPHRKDVFNLGMVEGKKLKDLEKNRFLEALASLRDEDIMGGNVLNILESFKDNNSEELKEFVSDKILEMCKDKIKELSNG